MKSSLQRTLELVVRDLGHIPPFKNSKQIMRKGKNGPPFIGTKTEYKKDMERIIKSFVFQLDSLYQTSVAEMETAPSRASWIASLAPSDDSRKWIRACCWEWEEVAKGEEGAVITIERYE